MMNNQAIKTPTTPFAGYDCIRLANESVALWVTVSAGPRVIGLSLNGRDNLLAVVPDATAITPSGRPYQFRGGHRLWHAPEHPERSYGPDDTPVEAALVENRLQLRQSSEIHLTGIEKEIVITLPDDGPRILVDHRLTNRGQWPVTLAPWAITQFVPGGLAILPMDAPSTGLLPNRRLALWPYTRLSSSHMHWGEHYLFVRADLKGSERLKIGWANAAGWLAYWIAGTLFVKKVGFDPAAEYPDFGSSSECYADARFLELESLGPLVTLQPGDCADHREEWLVYAQVPALDPHDEGQLGDFLGSLPFLETRE